MSDFAEKVLLELVKTVFGLGLLASTWFVGQKILARWDLRKKRQELDVAAAQKFYELYGEFKAVWRLWKVLKGPEDTSKPSFVPKEPLDERLELLKRATAAEGGIEAITLKLATERELRKPEIRCLALFRHSYQILREQIRYDAKLEWKRDSAQYVLFNRLASDVARLISSNRSFEPPSAEKANESLRAITKLASEEWDSEVRKRGGRI